MTAIIGRATFFARMRASGLCGPTLSQTEVDGMTGLLDAWDRLGWPPDLRPIAYTLATAWHECRLDLTVRETGRGRGLPYGKPVNGRIYYGRGAAQLTWLDNYSRFGRLLNLDLVGNPDLALVPETSAAILVLGARDGLFRKGHTLARYFDADTDDPVGARAIINGDVTANGPRVAGHHRVFLTALQAACAPAGPPIAAASPAPAPAAPPPGRDGPLGRFLATLRDNLRKGA